MDHNEIEAKLADLEERLTLKGEALEASKRALAALYEAESERTPEERRRFSVLLIKENDKAFLFSAGPLVEEEDTLDFDYVIVEKPGLDAIICAEWEKWQFRKYGLFG